MEAVRNTMTRISLALTALLLVPAAGAWAEPKVVVSIKPLHSLVAAVMEGVGTPQLLLAGGESPHTVALRPSQTRALAAADLVFWIGEDLETFLVRPLAALGGKTRVVPLSRAAGVQLLPTRKGGIWESDDHDHGGHKHGNHGGKSKGTDPHLWLDPDNALAIARAAAAEVGKLHPGHRPRLDANVKALASRLEALDAELRGTLAPVRSIPYIVFHDAYQYFEKHYGLAAAGAITLSPERPPGVQRLREIRETIRKRNVRCVFSEPQFPPGLVATATEGSKARQGVLDPEGAPDLEAGPQAYFVLMRELADNLRSCLQSP